MIDLFRVAGQQTNITDLSRGLMCSFLINEGILGLFILTVREKRTSQYPRILTTEMPIPNHLARLCFQV